MSTPESLEGPTMHPLVRERLLAIDWDPVTYPVELLELRTDEQAMLDMVAQDRAVREIASTEGIPLAVAHSRYHAGLGKQQARNGLERDILTLPPDAQRVVILNDIFGGIWNKGDNVVINSAIEVVVANTPQLDELLGPVWRRRPQISAMPIQTVRDRVVAYDAAAGPKWRNSPVILTQDQEVVLHRAALYDQVFGDDWHMKPTILTNDPKTVIASSRALERLGITRENTPLSSYFNLLGTTVANKRRKVHFIRSEILSHQQVRTRERGQGASKADLVRARQRQTPKDRDREALEIAEAREFLEHLGAYGLVGSVDSIRKWASDHGYHPNS